MKYLHAILILLILIAYVYTEELEINSLELDSLYLEFIQDSTFINKVNNPDMSLLNNCVKKSSNAYPKSKTKWSVFSGALSEITFSSHFETCWCQHDWFWDLLGPILGGFWGRKSTPNREKIMAKLCLKNA